MPNKTSSYIHTYAYIKDISNTWMTYENGPFNDYSTYNIIWAIKTVAKEHISRGDKNCEQLFEDFQKKRDYVECHCGPVY